MILEHIWDFHFDPQTNVVDVLICRLRSKVDKDFPEKMVKTVRGSGMYLKRLINLPRTIGFRVAGWYVFIFTLSSLCFF